jgi:transcriptional regulator
MTLYVPKAFGDNDPALIARLVREYPFATLITATPTQPVITHLPLVYRPGDGPHGTLIGHFARANPHVGAVASGESIALFHGPHAYVSPSWYADPALNVPTWNYAVAHLHGPIALAADPAATRRLLDEMIAVFESERPAPWRMALDAGREAAMLGAIVGFTMQVARVEAKFKLSQNRSAADCDRVAAALDADGPGDAAATAAWMRMTQRRGRLGEA